MHASSNNSNTNTTTTTTTETLRPLLAKLIYYQRGSELAAQRNWNEMTRLQLERELWVRGRLGEEEVLTEWKLRLRLAGVMFEERGKEEEEEEEAEEEEEEEGKGDVEEDEDFPLAAGGSSSGGKGLETGEQKGIFTKKNGAVMVF